MTIAEMVQAAILGGIIGAPAPYESDPQFERAAAVGEGLSLAAPFALPLAAAVSGMKKAATVRELATEAAPKAVKVYHGSPKKFDTFSVEQAGTTTDAGHLGRGGYFSTDPKVADPFPIKYEAEVTLRNPLKISLPSWGADKRAIVSKALGLPTNATPEEVTAAARAKGYDGVMLDYSPVGYKHQEVVVFDSGQVGSLRDLSQPKAITAYHGSPYDFDTFSLEKIGTGEGAQAYGHGLYFAENPAVAADYRRSLARPSAENPAWRLRGEPVAAGTDRYRLASILESSPIKDGESVPNYVRRRIKEREDHAAFAERVYGADTAGMYRSQVEELKRINPSELTRHNPGKTYEVAIQADPDEFLHWDKPLSEQSEKVRKVIGNLVERDIDQESGWLKLTGREALSAVSERSGYRGGGEAALRQAGIKGIKYLDQGSRTAGEGSHNYVVFDDAIIAIMKKFGISLPVAASLAKWQQSQSKPASK